MISRRFLNALSVLLILVTPASTGAQEATPTPATPSPPTYVATDLGDWTPEGINDAGQIVGSMVTEGGMHAALWRDGQLTELGTLPGGRSSEANAINTAGQVAGEADLSDGSRHAVLWDQGQIIDLDTQGSRWSFALGINDAGQVVGVAPDADGFMSATLWDHGQVTTLAAGEGWAHAINAAGVVAGSSGDRAVVWNHGVMTALPDVPEGSARSAALATNDAGQVAGWVEDANGLMRAVLWDDDQITVLDTLPGGKNSLAIAINDAGQIVGRVTAGGAMHAVLWDDGQLVDLGLVVEGLENTDAVDINDAGQIVGSATSGGRGGGQHAVRWDSSATSPPTAGSVLSPVPATARWCVAAGDDSLRGPPVALADVFQARALVVAGDLVVVGGFDDEGAVLVCVFDVSPAASAHARSQRTDDVSPPAASTMRGSIAKPSGPSEPDDWNKVLAVIAVPAAIARSSGVAARRDRHVPPLRIRAGARHALAARRPA